MNPRIHPRPSRFPVTVLAGGLSQRMGFPKLKLAENQVPIINSMGERLISSGWTDLAIIISDLQLKEFVKEFLPKAFIIVNHCPSDGMISSLRLGIAWAGEFEYSGVLAWPVDCPLVTETTLHYLRQAASSDNVVIPVYESQRGHPTWWGKSSWAALKSPSADVGVKSIIHDGLVNVQEVMVNDPNILININTLEQARFYHLEEFAPR
ncbi:MAG: NTP transferase domain-containing protein [Calditrichota bacterium]